MSETDSFIREVTEEVRQDRMLRYWKRYGPWAGAAIVLVVGAAALWNWQQSRQAEQARALGGEFLAAEPGDVAAAADLVGRVGGPAALVARLTHAGALAGDGQTDAAIEAYRGVAEDAAAPARYSDLAALAALRLGVPQMETDAALERLAPLTAEGAPYRLLALELGAVLKLNAGRTEAAHADLRTILSAQGLTGGLEQRASALLSASGGDAPAATN